MGNNVKKISWYEMYETFCKFNEQNGNDSSKFIEGVVVYKKDGFKKEFWSLKSRSYKVKSNTWGFMTNKAGHCIIGEALDGTERIRLDWHNWDVEYCYLLNNK